jgi:hypothetical protein
MCTGAAKVTVGNQRAHPASNMTELIIVTGSDFEAFLDRERNQPARFQLVQRERFFYVYMASGR